MRILFSTTKASKTQLITSSLIGKSCLAEPLQTTSHESQISADCQQNFLSPRHDTSGRILLVNFLKGNPNSQGILNWIIQILLLIQEAAQKYRKLTDYWTKSCYLSAFLSVYCDLHFLHLPSGRAFSVLGHSTPRDDVEFQRRKWSFVKYIVSFFGLQMVFSKLSLAKYQNSRVSSNFNLRYFMSSINYRT